MTSERIQRRIDAFLDQAEAASDRQDWPSLAGAARAVLAIDPGHADASAFLKMAEANLNGQSAPAPPAAEQAAKPSATQQPTSFAGGRYEVRRFLGEGGKKRVFLAHDTRLDRDVAFALIKTEGLDEVGRERIVREAQAMGRLGAHPHIVTIFEIGEEGGSPYVVNELLAGGDVEGELEKAGGPLPLARALEIATGVVRGLAFAHERGIVHRDLKPGNVWLTADGTAKIGDFGLAVSLDRSRLTQHGMMVGTVAYMPPEQALGGEVTPQADFYSLGAMLYELVTGRPPFQADDPTAVISQHINTPPVAPSWHSEHCPPDLEALILRLLSKVPADRPASASEVLTALEAVDPNARSASHSDSSANPLDRLARGVFVGRERELERLRAAFDDAFAGRGSVVMLVGEPGIGKTRTVQEVETYARIRGGRVIWGRAHESAGAPPYRPWVQAANTYSNLWGLDGVGPQLAAEDTAELSRIFPLLRQQPNYVAPPEIVDPASAQFRLFEAYLKLLRVFASEAPLVVVLDDLHWADKPTLLLLQHVARELGRVRLLIVGTYRDTELSRTHPLSEALAELNREGSFQRVNLGGLSRDEVADYIRGTVGIEPSRALVERVHEETEGNPFFLHEVVNLMTEEGTISSDPVSDIAIPEGVREALGRRLDRLSEETNALLQYAAVAGRQFSYDTLKLVTEHNDDMLLRLIEEGLAARVIEETAQPGRYQFTHALMQETLLEELSTTRRVRMHGEVGEAIERRYGGDAPEQAARLAIHYGQSATLNSAHAELAVKYADLAAVQSARLFAWDDAATHLERCMSIAGTNGIPVDEANLLLRRGEARVASVSLREGWRDLLEAADRFRAQDDWTGQARAALAASLVSGPANRHDAVLTAALEAPGEPDETLLALLLARRARIRGRDGEPDAERAKGIAGAFDHPAVRAELLAFDGMRLVRQHRYESAAPILHEAFALFDAQGMYPSAVSVLASEHDCYLLSGDYARTMAYYDDVLAYAREKRQRIQLHVWLGDSGALAVIAGNVRLARERLEEASPSVVYVYHSNRIALSEFTADLDDVASSLPDPASVGNVTELAETVRWLRARACYLAGNLAAAREEVAAAHELVGPDSRITHGFGALDGVLAAVGTDEQVRAAYERLAQAPAVRMVVWCSADRLRGELALRLGLIHDASEHLAAALEWSEREVCPVEAGRCHLGLAMVAERRGDHALALEHLDAAGELFSRHGAKLYLDQVLAKKDFLKA